jgi:flavorubredoxin
MTTAFTAAPGVDVITTTAVIPAFGSIAINAFVLHGSEPVLVDTGTVAGSADFMTALASVIDPSELRWIWLTHTDFDHIGSLASLLQANPHLRVITSFLGVGIMGLSSAPLPMDRVHLINPGQSVTVGDRRLTAVRPPLFDNPITTGFVDDRSGILFSSDCFGALLPEVPLDAADLDPADLRAGQVLWATIDSPWVHRVDRDAFGHALDQVRQIEPTMVCSSHLPPAPGAMLDVFVDSLAKVPAAEPFVGPDHAALEAMLAGMVTAPATSDG